MRTLLLGAALLFSFQALAATSKDCDELKVWRTRLALFASNLQNMNTTRTPEGGPYKPLVVKSCSNGGCFLDDPPPPAMRYLPDHPDADHEGYVAFPNMDPKIEYATFVIAAKVLRQLAENHTCGTRMVNDGEMDAIEYPSTPDEPREDRFTFDKTGNVVSWAEVSSQGKMTAIGLTADGKIK